NVAADGGPSGGLCMNVHISYKISKTPDLEKLINQQVEKLGKYLQVFRPELVHLKGILEENSARQGFAVLLNLRLPSGQMAAQESGPTATVAVKAAFDAVTEQLKKHKEVLRNRHKRVRKRGPGRAEIGTVPFEETVAAVRPKQVSASDISSYIDVNLPRLKRFIQRELDHRESQGELLSGQVQVEEVVDEAIANALGEQHDKPEPMKVEPWLYRLAKQAIDRLAWEGSDVLATDETALQFQQPDEPAFEENVIPDPSANNPEELADGSGITFSSNAGSSGCWNCNAVSSVA